MVPKLGLLGEASILRVPGHIPEYGPDRSRKGDSYGTNNNQDVPSEGHHSSICDSKGGCGGLASEERVIFVLELLEPTLPVHFHRFHKKSIQGVETKATREPFLVHLELGLPKEEAHCISNLTRSCNSQSMSSKTSWS